MQTETWILNTQLASYTGNGEPTAVMGGKDLNEVICLLGEGDNKLANAKLIAAAPALLKTLGDIMNKLQEHQSTESKILAGYTLCANIEGMTELLNNATSAYIKATQ